MLFRQLGVMIGVAFGAVGMRWGPVTHVLRLRPAGRGVVAVAFVVVVERGGGEVRGGGGVDAGVGGGGGQVGRRGGGERTAQDFGGGWRGGGGGGRVMARVHVYWFQLGRYIMFYQTSSLSYG